MPVVKMPNGQLVEMPDNPTPEQVTKLRAIQASQQKVIASVPVAAEPGLLEGMWNDVKNLGSAAYKGLASLPAAAADVFAAQPDMADALASKVAGRQIRPTGDTSGPVTAALQKTGYQPKTRGEEIASALTQGATSALISPGGLQAPLRTMAVGASSAAGAEGAAKALGEGVPQRVIGGLLGGLAGGLATGVRTNRQDIAREALEGLSPDDLARAQANMQSMRAAGIPGNLSQAMERPSNIDTIVDALANNRYGTKTQAQLRAQPQQTRMALEMEVAQLPGDIRTPQQSANNMQNVTTAAVEAARRQRQSAWETNYNRGVGDITKDLVEARVNAQGVEAAAAAKARNIKANPLASPASPERLRSMEAQQELAAAQTATNQAAAAQAAQGTVPVRTVQQLYNSLKRDAATKPNQELGARLSALADNLKNADGNFILDGEQLNGILKEAATKLKSPDLATKGMDAGAANYMQKAIIQARDSLGETFEPLKRANAAYKQLTEDVVNPLKKSVVGRVAGRRGELSDTEAVRGRMKQLFDQGTVPGSKSSDILKLEKEIRDVKAGQYGAEIDGPTAYQDAVKTWIGENISNAVKPVGGRLNEDLARRLHSAFAGNETRSQGFRDMLVGLARSQQLPDNALYPGMEKFLKIVGNVSRRPGSVSGATRQGLDEMAQSSALGSVGRFSVITPVRQPILKWMDYLKADAYRAMDDILTNPEGVAMLQKLAKQNAMSPAAANTVSTFLATIGAQRPEAASQEQESQR